ncbi:MAG: hypothetical protein A2177_08905 [Spirochaetes bacterium RBG_13_68_11]|nr:MAG: hypothetical protein A2177_08905 [Spirochaetes bacterium RBG_13_68_11]
MEGAMRVKHVLQVAGVALALLAVLFGCSFGVTIQGRIEQFLEDLNATSRDQLYLNLDPALTDYNSLKDPLYWDGWFPLVGGGTSYFLVNQVTDDSGVTTAIVTADISGPATFLGPKALVIGLVKDGLNWMIHTITLDAIDVVPYNP